MWRLDTENGSYAIKQLSPHLDLNNQQVVKNYELSEKSAVRFIRFGIPGVSALQQSGKTLLRVDGNGFLVYPWVCAKTLDHSIVSAIHAQKIATILAKMHRLDLQEPEIGQPQFSTHTKQKLLTLFEKAEDFGCSFAEILLQNQAVILSANEAYQRAISTLQMDTVVSHCDLDQKNVLWDSNDNPLLIDWESASNINPTFDIINTAFYWSGITSTFDKNLFFNMLQTYEKAGGIVNKRHLVAACNGVFGWIAWLIYNIERSCVFGESESKNIGIEQVYQTMKTMLQLHQVMPEIIKAI